MRRVVDGVELLDRPTPVAERAASLADVDRLNSWFGGHALTLRHVARALRNVPRDRPLRIEDSGAGRGDLAMRLVRWGRRCGRPVTVLALDREADTAVLACRATGEYPEIRVVRADASALPLRTGSVDLIVSSLVLHHLGPEDAASALAEMARASRLGFIVNDLWRARLGVALVWLATRALRCHPISRHDGPLSVRRSYSPGEIRSLAEVATIRRLEVRRYPLLLRVIARGGP
jgi:SAM-dependent methyltransferase